MHIAHPLELITMVHEVYTLVPLGHTPNMLTWNYQSESINMVAYSLDYIYQCLLQMTHQGIIKLRLRPQMKGSKSIEM
mgnify:CR=1 FL=1